ncbi:cubilin [Rhinoraja longicauda]
MSYCRHSTWLPILISLLCTLKCESENDGNNQQRSISSDQPRITSNNGNLIFQTGNQKSIEFKTSAFGKIKLNNNDLEQLSMQIIKNKDDIVELKTSGVPSPQNTSDQISQLNKRVLVLEALIQNIQTVLQRQACISNPCQNGGTCLNLVDSFFCICTNNWKGPTCSDDINECEVYAGSPLACQNGATCMNTQGNYSCRCTPEWSGPHCTSKYDDCQGGSQTRCEHGICIDLNRVQPNQAKYHCICEDGWSQPSIGSACSSDIDECSLPVQPCSTNPPVSCLNSPGSYSCENCPAGWEGDALRCQDIDECKTNIGGCSEVPFVQCINVLGSYHCGLCPAGYQADGKNCTQIDLCSANNGGCHHLASCTYNPGDNVPTCTCPADYFGNGNGDNGCIPGIDLCQHSNPCMNGQCCAVFSSYKCICAPGWTGINCTQNINDCASSPCQNGGNCTDGITAYTCTCMRGWTGPECQIRQQACGGHLNETFGVISVPGYPGNNLPSNDCYWTISVSPNLLIAFAFGHLHFGSHQNCSLNYLEIRDGLLEHDPILHRYCSNESPPPLLTPGPNAWIHFHSYNNVNDQGFHVTYITLSAEPGCGGMYEESEGILTSPNWPNSYPSGRQCIYVIQQPKGERIHLQFTHVELEFHVNCSLDYIEVYDGEAETDHLIGRYCGSKAPAPITTRGNKLWLKFKTHTSGAKKGFVAVYKVACGGILHGKGVIQSPYYPNPYPHDRSCEWVITQSEGYVVTLKLISFDIEKVVNCSHDYLEIRDGAVEDSPLIGKYCGAVLPPTVWSIQPSMYIKFKMDSNEANNGFRAEYESAKKGCGEVLTQSVGTITSPEHSAGYPHDGKCIWYISVQAGHVIHLTFISFSMEFNINCTKGYVEVYDNHVNHGRRIGRYCGRSVPPSLTSSGNSMSLLYVSDSNAPTEGFLAMYDSLDASTGLRSCLLLNLCCSISSSSPRGVSKDEICKEEFFEPTGIFTSPNYPNGYSIYQECIYIINVEENKQILLNFTDFKVDGYQACTSACVEIRNGEYETSPLVGQYCSGKPPPLIRSHSNSLWIKFKSDNIFEYHAFRAHWNGTSTGQVQKDGSLANAMPPFKKGYKEMLGNDRLLSLTSVVYNGININSQILFKLCGNQMPASILSSKNNMYIELQTDSSVATGGFLAKYRHICQGGIIANHSNGVLESTNFPQPYPPKQDCNWTIQATAGNTINYTFSAFNLDFNSCHLAWLKLYDGPSAQSHLIGTYCRNTLPPSGTTSGSSLHVAFHSESCFSGNGFQMLWLQNGCGGIVTAPTGEIHSPNYPNPYGINVDCSWVISVDTHYSIFIHFLDFDLAHQQSCDFDYIAVYDGSNEASPLLRKLCGSIDPEAIISSHNVVYIHFHSLNSFDSRGFRLRFNQVCGSYIVTDDIGGAITSPLYPNNYSNNQNCSWTIQAQKPFNRVTVSFTDFAIENSGAGCPADVLQIFDRDNHGASSVSRYCGSTIPDPITSFSDTLLVNFISNDVHSSRGFRATYAASTSVQQTVSDSTINGKGFLLEWFAVQYINNPNATPTLQPGPCGGDVESGERPSFLFSPGWPSSYGTHLDCSWIIWAPQSTVQLNILALDIQPDASCNYDKLVIRDGDNNLSPILATLCGRELPGTLRSTGEAMFLRFTSDEYTSGGGFNASYHTTCGDHLTADHGVITSPNYPHTYTPNLSCVWHVDVTSGFIIAVHFNQPFQIQGSGNECTSGDYLELRNGPDRSSAPLTSHGRIERYCGENPPTTMYTTDNQLFVHFISDGINEGHGFNFTYKASSLECGGELTAGSGTINSPNYPHSYPHSLECEWRITVQGGRRVTLIFNDLQLEMHDQCNYDYVIIYNGLHQSSPRLQKYCGIIESGTQVRSSGNTMRVAFVTDSATSYRGFDATYTSEEGAVCGGTLMGPDSGDFSSPSYDGTSNDKNNLNCEWVIQNSHIANSSIYIQFTSFHLGQDPDCQQDYIELRVGDSNGDLIARLCGQTAPSPLLIPFTQIWVQFISNSPVQDLGFVAKYSFTKCGGIQTGESGFISSPNFPSPYNSLTHCAWILEAPEGHTITLSFIHFNSEHHLACDGGSVTILNGGSFNSPIIGQYCGSTPVKEIKSGSNKLFIFFHSEHSVHQGGFYSTWKTDSLGCGGYFHAESGSFKSPNWPQNFPSNSECTWRIVGQESKHFEITFDKNFQIPHSTENCGSSYVKMWGGISETDESLLATLCGNTAPPSPVIAPANVVSVRFQSKGSTGTGFSASFTNRCGANFTSSAGRIMSPNYPDRYDPNLNCEYLINGASHQFTILQFEAFSMEEDSLCAHDNLKIYSGITASRYPVATLCGSVIPGPISTYGPMLLVFSTDSIKTHTGFMANFHFAPCGGRFHGSNGTLSSPIYSRNQYSNINCTFHITVAENKIVKLMFNEFVLGTSATCTFNYVDVYNGPNTFAPLLGQFCGSDIPPVLRSTNNSIFLVFKTHGFHNFRGWRATYIETSRQ